MSLIFKVTHDNSQDDCSWCSCTKEEKYTYKCSGKPPEEGTFTKAYLDEIKERQQYSVCCCGASTLDGPQTGHAHYCILSNRNFKDTED